MSRLAELRARRLGVEKRTPRLRTVSGPILHPCVADPAYVGWCAVRDDEVPKLLRDLQGKAAIVDKTSRGVYIVIRHVPVGEVVWAYVDPATRRPFVTVLFNDDEDGDEAWDAVQEGKLRHFRFEYIVPREYKTYRNDTSEDRVASMEPVCVTLVEEANFGFEPFKI